ncbi:MAG: response regulator transcription factor, partial [Clostridia bacterium]|nr:response regulator transcription factor [Clostridia bacterium]
MKTVFVVDDEENIRYLVRQYLLREGFQVETFASVEELRARLESGYPDLVILDIMLPGEDGLAFCRELRRRSEVPVIFLSARDEEVDRVLGLELGGDDYVTKPFSPRELVARVRSVLRRASPSRPAEKVSAGDVAIYPADRRVTSCGREVLLTPKEYDLLLLLCRHPQRAFSRQELLDLIWGYDYVGDARAVDDLVKRVRKKLRSAGSATQI